MSSTCSAIFASNLKESTEVHLKCLTSTVNHPLKKSTFPDELKQCKVITVSKNLTLYRRKIIDKGFWYYKSWLATIKLHEYGFSKQALSFRRSSLKNRRQRVQINLKNNKFSSLKEVTAGVPQGSIDDPHIFNLFVNNIFFFICLSNLSNYANDNHLVTTRTDIQLIKQMFLSNFRTLNNWLKSFNFQS